MCGIVPSSSYCALRTQNNEPNNVRMHENVQGEALFQSVNVSMQYVPNITYVRMYVRMWRVTTTQAYVEREGKRGRDEGRK